MNRTGTKSRGPSRRTKTSAVSLAEILFGTDPSKAEPTLQTPCSQCNGNHNGNGNGAKANLVATPLAPRPMPMPPPTHHAGAHWIMEALAAARSYHNWHKRPLDSDDEDEGEDVDGHPSEDEAEVRAEWRDRNKRARNLFAEDDSQDAVDDNAEYKPSADSENEEESSSISIESEEESCSDAEAATTT
jgi:hypothetical protein